MVYVGPVFFDKQGSYQGQFIFDTGSDWVVTTSVACKECRFHYYDHNASKTLSSIYEHKWHINYESLQLRGLRVIDKVCLAPGKACA